MKSRTALLLLCTSLLASACAPAYRSRVIETPDTRGLKPWEKPYEINGERYKPMRRGEDAGFVEQGVASWYGHHFHGKKTSNGEIYDMHARTAAHKTLPLGVTVKVKNLANGRETLARINDRGPFVKGRIIDLSYTLAKELGVDGPGTAPVRIEALGYRETGAGGEIVYRQPKSYTIGNYAVQIGAFTVRDNADRLADQMRGLHGAASVQEGWVNGKLFYRVRVGKYTTVASAESAKSGFEQGGYANSFVVGLD